MKLLAALPLLAVALSASPLTCPPSFSQDRAMVDPACAGIGATITALPGAHFIASFEDFPFNAAANDHDYNDLNFGVQVSADAQSAMVTYLGSLAVWMDYLQLDGADLFYNYASNPGDTVGVATVPGRVIPFELFVNAGIGPSWTWSMGTVQDWAVCDSGCGTPVPEPGYLLLMLVAFTAVLLVAAWRKL